MIDLSRLFKKGDWEKAMLMNVKAGTFPLVSKGLEVTLKEEDGVKTLTLENASVMPREEDEPVDAYNAAVLRGERNCVETMVMNAADVTAVVYYRKSLIKTRN